MKHSATPVSRRVFLRHVAALSALGGAATPMALNLSLLGTASAYTATDYKALVCLFMRGGNDSFNTVLATDWASWSAYAATRGQDGTTIGLLPAGTAPRAGAHACTPARLGGVLPIRPANAQGRSFALHPLLRSVQRLFDTEKRLAVVANVGPLIVPTSKTDLARDDHPLPPQLYSHNDQQYMWQAMEPEGARAGWGGRMGDLLASVNGQSLFTAIVAGGQPVWATGLNVQPVRITGAGAVPFGFDPDGSLYGSSTAGAVLRRIGSHARGTHPMESDHARVVQRSLEMQAALASSLPPANDPSWSGSGVAGTGGSLRYISPSSQLAVANPLAAQLQTVLRIIAAADSGRLAVRRQIFFVEVASFDTHNDQNQRHGELMAQVAHAIDYFDTTLGSIGLRDAVTLLTQSEFGRSFTSNGDGTDHGWGGHHFVLGGAVKGGDIYGRFPTLGRKNAGDNRFASSDDQLHNGVLLPNLAVEQLAASLGRWMGLTDPELLSVLPRLANFPAGQLNLFR